MRRGGLWVGQGKSAINSCVRWVDGVGSVVLCGGCGWWKRFSVSWTNSEHLLSKQTCLVDAARVRIGIG